MIWIESVFNQSNWRCWWAWIDPLGGSWLALNCEGWGGVGAEPAHVGGCAVVRRRGGGAPRPRKRRVHAPATILPALKAQRNTFLFSMGIGLCYSPQGDPQPDKRLDLRGGEARLGDSGELSRVGRHQCM